MAKCPICSQQFSDGLEYCPHDGVLLVDADPLIGRTIDGKYRLEARLAAGGMGAVYRATQLALKRTVAVKVIHSASAGTQVAKRRFEREAVAVARLKHPHIVGVHDYGVAMGIGAYLVLEFVEGVSLRDELRNHGRFAVADAVAWTMQICLAVQAAHNAGLVHRDLKPENIILEPVSGERIAKVLDFGIARFMADEGDFATPLTGEMGIIGTPYYMSPEQCRGERAGPPSDIYSLGCVLFEMVTGRPPFRGDSSSAVLYQHVSARPPSPSDLVPGLRPAVEAAIMRALEKSPADRFASAHDFRVAIAGGSRGTTTTLPFGHESADRGLPGGSHVTPHNLPGDRTLFVGRARELVSLDTILRATRALTVCGPGGVGKTRCAVRLAERVLHRYPDGAWFVDLAATVDGTGVAQAVASVVGIRDDPNLTVAQTLERRLIHRRTIVVLDNCEHVIGGCATLAEQLLERCPELTIVATSREPLGIAGEAVWHLDPLPVPDPETMRTTADLLEYDVIALFLDRALKSRPSFVMSEDDAHLVADLCRRLDGVPLAIELAAARMRMLSIRQILDRLAGYRILSGGDRGSVPRQQTMQATMDWSYDLLTADEQRLLQRISLFAGKFTLEAVEYVGTGDTIHADDVLDLLASLVDKSLVMVEEREGSVDYRMLEMIRVYARGRLDAIDGAVAEILERLITWAIEYVERAFANFGGAGQDVWRAELSREHTNLLAALELGHSTFPESDRPLTLAVGLGAYWETYGYLRVAAEWYERLLDDLPCCDSVLRARALFRLGSLAHRRGDLTRSRELFEQCLALIRSTDRTQMIAETLSQLGMLASKTGDREHSIPLLTEALELHRTCGRPITIASALQSLGTAARALGDYCAAEEWLEQSLLEFRRAQFSQGLAVVLTELAYVRIVAGDLERARANAEEALLIAKRDDYRFVYTSGCVTLGEILARQHLFTAARSRFCDALRCAVELDAFEDVACALEGIAVVDVAEEQCARAIWLAGAASALRSVHDDPRVGTHDEMYEVAIDAARAVLGVLESTRLEAEGAAAPFDEVLARATESGPTMGEAPTIPMPR